MESMKTLEQLVTYYYQEDNNCAETLIKAANDYYQLDIEPNDCKLASGFGGGMFSGLACGALCASIMAISKKVIETKAYQQLEDFKPLIQYYVKTFEQELGGINCSDVKEKHHTKETKCLNTCLLAARVLEKTMEQAV